MLGKELLYIIPAAITAFLIAYTLIPVLQRGIKAINSRISKNDSDSVIDDSTASAVGIFTSVLITFHLWGGSGVVNSYSYLIAALFLFLLSGYKSGLFGAGWVNDLFFRISAAAVLVVGAGININDLGGLMGIGAVSYPVSVSISVAFILAFSHSLNHLNRVSGLSSGVVVIASGFIGIWFWMAGFLGFAILSFIIAASLIGFLVYNINPSDIKLGSTGSKAVGFVLGFLSLKFLVTNASVAGEAIHLANGIVFIASLMIVPITLSIMHLINDLYHRMESVGHKLFDVDELVELGLEEHQVSFLLWIVNIFVVGFAYSTMMLEVNIQIAILLVTGFALLHVLRSAAVFSEKILSSRAELRKQEQSSSAF
jgi:UDP-GlcNAc:undecaprenyl-phosphate/decaprenyl-phosphate GlcNAc-1-phosphate transferase